MLSELVAVSFDKIMQTRSYTVVVLATPEKSFAIYTDPSIGRTLQLQLTGVDKPRPLTHDLMQSIFQGFGIQVKQIVINDLQDTVYYARIYLEQEINGERQILELDGRPSDCITLALMNNVPVYCTRDVLERTVAVEEGS